MRRVSLLLVVAAFWITVVATAYGQTGWQFNPIQPCRLLDTRQSQPIQGGQTLTVNVQQGPCSGLSNALAYSFNVTVVPHKPLNYLTVWPTGETQPGVSNLNSYDGRTKAVAAIVPAGTSGGVNIYADDTTDVILDINGYFSAASASTLVFYPLPPCRLYDTRNGSYIQANQTVNFTIQGNCNVPASAEAYSLNVTALPLNNKPLGYLTVWPEGSPMPGTSTLNAPTGTATANAAIVQEGNGGAISVFASNDTNLLLDINGYFGPPGGTGQLALDPLVPCRVLDTRPHYFIDELQVEVKSSSCGIPVAAQGYILNATVLPQYYLAYLSLWADGNTPNVSTLNAYDGAVTSNLAIVPASAATGGILSYASNNTALIVDIFSYMAPTLDGHYALSMNGYQNGTPFVMGGSIIADGNGNISSGVLDFNIGSGSPSSGYSVTGTYSVGSTGVGTMQLNAGALGTLNFHFALSEQGSGQLIWDNADPSPRASGVFVTQLINDFVPPRPGNYAIGTVGADASFSPYAKAGEFQVGNGGIISAGSEDVNDNGTLGSRTFTGQFLQVSSQTGRGSAVLIFPNGITNKYAYYTISLNEFFMVGVDPLSNQDPLTQATTLTQQSGSFNTRSLNAPTVIETSGLAPNSGNPVPDVILGLASWDGNGNGTFSLDENTGGTMTLQQSSQGTYSVASNGRVTLTGFNGAAPILYLINPNQGFVLGQTSSVEAGIFEPQSAPPPYNNTSIFGTYFGGTIQTSQSSIVDTVGYITADGNGNITGVENTSGPSGTGTQNLSATYQVSSAGRAVLTGTPAGYMYVVSSSKVVLLPTGSEPALNVFTIAGTN